MNLDKLISKLRNYKMSPEEKEAQRRSFAYGNTHMSNPNITREMIDKAAEEIDANRNGK